MKLFTKFNKIYHRRSTTEPAENFIVVNSLVHSNLSLMKRDGGDEDDELEHGDDDEKEEGILQV